MPTSLHASASSAPPPGWSQSAEPFSFDQVAPDLRPQLERAALAIANGLRADVCHIYKLCAGQGALQLVAGVGRSAGISRRLALGPGLRSLEAHVLSAQTAVVAEDLDQDPRFQMASVVDRHHAASGLSVVIRGETAPFGVCSVYSRKRRSFTPADVELVEEMSNALTELFRSARLVRDRARFAAVAMSVDEAIVELTLDGAIFGWNAAAQALYGYSAADVAGQPVTRLFPPAGSLDLASMLGAVKDGAVVGPIDGVIRRHDDAAVDVELRLVPIILSDTRVVAASMIARDLTQQRKADHERRELLDRLRLSQRMEVIGRMASGVAHDFNNLLTVITGCTEFIQARVEDEAVLEDLRQIDQASRSAVQLARHLLAFGRPHVTSSTALDLTDVVKSARGMLRRLAGSRIQLMVLESHAPVVVRADAVEIERILINLIVNARDAMPQGGRIFIESSLTTITDELRSGHPERRPGTYGRLQVTDTGVGIDPAVLPRVFEPFVTTKGVCSGTGLGLSTVHDIVEQSGGFVTVNNEPEEGATFNIYIPAVGLWSGQ